MTTISAHPFVAAAVAAPDGLSATEAPHPTILALDASSTNLGYCLYAGCVLSSGEHKLQGGDIAAKCQTAYDLLVLLLERWPAIDAIAIESPVARFASSVIPQARVSGALLCCAAQRWKPVIEITPAAAKRVLTGHGNATKEEMQRAAAVHGVSGEHASDALGIALAAAPRIRMEVAA